MGIKYLDEPKTSGRIKYLDEKPSQKFLKAGKEVSEQDFLSPGKLHIQSPLLAATKGASDVIGGPFAPNYYASRIPKFIGGQGLGHPGAMRYAEEVSKPLEEAKIEGIPGQVGYGLAQVAPILAGAPTPFMAGAKGLLGVASKIPLVGKIARAPIARTALGFGGYEAAKGLVGGEADVAKSFGEGVVGGAGYHAGLRGGATLGKMLLPTKIAERVGSAAGSGTVGALTAPEGEKISSAITGAGFGARYPGRAFGYKTPVELSKQAVDIYRNILRPTQSETQLIEVRKGKDLDHYFKLAAEENLPIEKTSENKLDTEQAREILQTKIKTTQSELDKILEKDTTNYFDLLKIEQQAKKSAKEQISNAKELETANQQIEDYISAEIARHKGRTVSASSLNKIKQGMWSVGYDALRPTSQENARRIGFSAKDAIEKAYPNNIVRTLNERSGDFITLSRLLEKAHGRVIQKGRIGGYAARGTGLIIGGAAGQLIPIPGVGMAAGAWAGHKLGGKVNEYLSSPERLSKVAGKKMAESKNVGKEQFIDTAFKNLTKSPVFIPKSKTSPLLASGQGMTKLKGKSGQAVFGRQEPQKPVFGVKPQEPTITPIQKPIVQPAKDLLSKTGVVEPPLTAAEAVKQGMGAEEWVNSEIKKWNDGFWKVKPNAKIVNIPIEDIGKSINIRQEKTADKGVKEWIEKIRNGERPTILVGMRENLSKGNIGNRPIEPTVLDGYHRLEAYRKLGIKEVPVLDNTPKSQLLSEYEAAKRQQPPINLKSKIMAAGAPVKPVEARNDLVTLYHATRKPLLIKKEGIKLSEAGVLRKEGKKLVYTASTAQKALMALDYEEALKIQVGQKVRKIGNQFVIEIQVPTKDIEVRPNGDIILKRDVSPKEITKLISKSQSLSEYEAAKGEKGKGTALGLAGLTAAGTLVAGQAQADEKKQTFSDEDAILSIIGEAENQGADGMRAVASAIRNRGTLKGVYGLNAPRVKSKKYSKEIYAQAKKAWEESAKNDYVKGATHWEGTVFKKPYWVDSMDEVMTVGQQRFYKEKIKNKSSKPADKG